MRSRSRLIRNAAIAALIGTTAGAAAGVWSVRDRTGSVAVSPVSGRDVTAGDGLSSSTPVATRGVVPSTAPVATLRSGPAQGDSQKLVQQARTLAQVPDVSALVALRESIGRRANEGGEQESPATQELIREVERYLGEARELRLKLDGEALRRDQTANPPRTGRR
jgi:hypothetical protein